MTLSQLWIDFLPDLAEISAELNQIRAASDGRQVLHRLAELAARAAGPADARAMIQPYAPDRPAPEETIVAGAVGKDAPWPDHLIERAAREQRPAEDEHWTAIPFVVDGQVLGVMVAGSASAPLTPPQQALLSHLAHLAANAIFQSQYLSEIRRSLERKVAELEELRRAERLISSRLRLDETLHEILRIGLQMTSAQYGSFRLLDKESGELVLSAIASSTDRPPPKERLPVNEESIVGWVAFHRAPLRVDDLAEEPWRGMYQPLMAGQPMRSELAVPLIGAGGGLEGVLNLESPAPRAFSADDERLLQALATQAVIAIQEAKLLDAMQEIVEELLTRSREELFHLLIRRACDLINAPIGAIWTLAEDDPHTLVLREATGGHRRGDRLPVSDSLTGKAILLRAPITCADVRREPSFHYVDLARSQGWVSALIVPLIGRANREPVGAFSVYTLEPREFSAWDKRLISCLANHAAIALQDAEQMEQLQRALERQTMAETFAAVGDVAANLLHRLNNKIGTIPVRVQGLESKRPQLFADPYVASNLNDIRESARAAMAIVRESMTHLHPTQAGPVDVARCVRKALDEASLPPTVELITEGMSRLPPVLAGEQQLKFVFLNLIENAVDAMRGRGTISIRGAVADDAVEISVSDTGPGIPPELHERIFQLHFSTKRSRKRLGFGLWWARTFVHRYEGTLEVVSEPGQGATFTVRLPIWKEAAS